MSEATDNGILENYKRLIETQEQLNGAILKILFERLSKDDLFQNIAKVDIDVFGYDTEAICLDSNVPTFDIFYVCIKGNLIFVGIYDDIDDGRAYCINIASIDNFNDVVKKIKDEYLFSIGD